MNINDSIIKLKNIETQIKEYKDFLDELIEEKDILPVEKETLSVSSALDTALAKLETLTDLLDHSCFVRDNTLCAIFTRILRFQRDLEKLEIDIPDVDADGNRYIDIILENLRNSANILNNLLKVKI